MHDRKHLCRFGKARGRIELSMIVTYFQCLTLRVRSGHLSNALTRERLWLTEKFVSPPYQSQSEEEEEEVVVVVIVVVAIICSRLLNRHKVYFKSTYWGGGGGWGWGWGRVAMSCGGRGERRKYRHFAVWRKFI